MRTGSTGRKGKTPPAPSTGPANAQPAPPPTASATPSPPSAPPSAAEARAAPPRKGRDPLLAGICHDLRAPLAAVTMGANFVLQTTPDEPATARSRRVLAAILRSCKQMERLVRDFGDYSEIEAGAVELRLGVNDAGELAEIAAEAARPEAAARKVTIAVERTDVPLPVTCDRDRLLRALGHVLDNAIRFSPEGGEVALAVAHDAETIRFVVTDRGPGLSEETLTHLYDRTWHVKQPGRTGAGLGLAIVRGIVEAHGGQLAIATTKGGPTEITLSIPHEARAPEDATVH